MGSSMKIEKGDKVLKIMPPEGFSSAWVSKGEVTEVTDKIITCVIDVDVPRTMTFRRRTGQMIGDESQFIIRMPE